MFYGQIAPRLVQSYLDKEGYKERVEESSLGQGTSIKCKFEQKEASLVQGSFLVPRSCSRRSIKSTPSVSTRSCKFTTDVSIGGELAAKVNGLIHRVHCGGSTACAGHAPP